MILNDLISLPVNCARKAVNGFCSHLNNRLDGVENEVGCVLIARQSKTAGFDASLIFS